MKHPREFLVEGDKKVVYLGPKVPLQYLIGSILHSLYFKLIRPQRTLLILFRSSLNFSAIVVWTE